MLSLLPLITAKHLAAPARKIFVRTSQQPSRSHFVLRARGRHREGSLKLRHPPLRSTTQQFWVRSASRVRPWDECWNWSSAILVLFLSFRFPCKETMSPNPVFPLYGEQLNAFGEVRVLEESFWWFSNLPFPMHLLSVYCCKCYQGAPNFVRWHTKSVRGGKVETSIHRLFWYCR